jgi:hypothetical protein
MRVNGPNRADSFGTIEGSKSREDSLKLVEHDFSACNQAGRDLVVKPLAQCLDLIHREWGIDVIDADIWR